MTKSTQNGELLQEPLLSADTDQNTNNDNAIFAIDDELELISHKELIQLNTKEGNLELARRLKTADYLDLSTEEKKELLDTYIRTHKCENIFIKTHAYLGYL